MKELLANLKKLKPAQALLLLLILCVGCALALKNADTQSDLRTDAEKRAESVLSEIEGAGRVRVMLYAQEEAQGFGQAKEKTIGAVLVSEGAGDPAVRIRLLQAARTLFALPANSIEIFQMEEAP